MSPDPNDPLYQTWLVLKKFTETDADLTSEEWETLSWVTLVDKSWLMFAPGNICWAPSVEERIANLAFYKSLPR